MLVLFNKYHFQGFGREGTVQMRCLDHIDMLIIISDIS